VDATIVIAPEAIVFGVVLLAICRGAKMPWREARGAPIGRTRRGDKAMHASLATCVGVAGRLAYTTDAVPRDWRLSVTVVDVGMLVLQEEEAQ
jgi:hypothetical protein